jgi:hypothetical protein
MIPLVAYLSGLVLSWYQNKFIVLDASRRPIVLSTPTNQVALYIGRLVITYGGLAGLLVAHGFRSAILAFATYWVLSEVTFRIYFNREVRRVAEILMSETPAPSEDHTPSGKAEAFENATRIVMGNMRTAGGGPF